MKWRVSVAVAFGLAAIVDHRLRESGLHSHAEQHRPPRGRQPYDPEVAGAWENVMQKQYRPEGRIFWPGTPWVPPGDVPEPVDCPR